MKHKKIIILKQESYRSVQTEKEEIIIKVSYPYLC